MSSGKKEQGATWATGGLIAGLLLGVVVGLITDIGVGLGIGIGIAVGAGVGVAGWLFSGDRRREEKN